MFRIKRLPLELVPPDVLEIAGNLHDAGFDAWFVGGALRDLLLETRPNDWDLATTASAAQVIGLFPRVIPVGIRHGTVRILGRMREVEVTSCGSQGHDSILADLGRRDFTINALALTYPQGVLLDPHQGRRDLRLGYLRAVGDARARFREDPLRVLRACRLVSVFGFRIHRDTFRALKEETQGLKKVAQERVREEMFKLVVGRHVFRAFEWMRRGGVIDEVIPELLGAQHRKGSRGQCLDRYRHTLSTLESCTPRLRLRLAALFHKMREDGKKDAGAPSSLKDGRFEESAGVAAQVLARWRASGRQIREIGDLIRNQVPEGVSKWDQTTLRRFLANLDPALLEDTLELAHADRVSRKDNAILIRELTWFRSQLDDLQASGQVVRMEDLAIRGEDVMRVLGVKPGPVVGRVLRELHERVIEDPDLNQREILIDFLGKIKL